MLKLKYMFENYELARLALESWEHDEEGLAEYLKYFRISSNAVYPFSVCGKRHFLRLSPVEEKQEENLRGELEFLQYLQKAGYPAMRPVAAAASAACEKGDCNTSRDVLLKLNTEWGEYYASVFEGVQGKPVEDTDYSAEIMISYGKALGKLHRLSMVYEPTCRKWSYTEVLTWIRSVLAEYQAPELMRQEADAVEQELDSLERDKESYGLIHYDFEPDNVFYDAAEGNCHVIDFEDGMYHFFLVDIEQVFDALSEELEGAALNQAREYFLQGYQSEKLLDAAYAQRLPLMRRFCNLLSYARLIRCVAEEVPEAPDWMGHLRDKLEMKIKHLESMVQ